MRDIFEKNEKLSRQSELKSASISFENKVLFRVPQEKDYFFLGCGGTFTVLRILPT